jgi:hypothetical protein
MLWRWVPELESIAAEAAPTKSGALKQGFE